MHSKLCDLTNVRNYSGICFTNLPSNGTAREVGGLISAMSSRKMVSELRMVMDIVIFSPELEGM